MLDYRLYFLQPSGRIVGAMVLKCRDDAHAFEVAQEHDMGMAMELWQDARLVMRFPRRET